MGYSPRDHEESDTTKQLSVHLIICLHRVPTVAHRSFNFHCSLQDLFVFKLEHWLFLGLGTADLETGCHTISPPSSQDFELGTEITYWFS